MSECPSKSWDRYYDSMESAEAEVIHEWIADQIEHTKNRLEENNLYTGIISIPRTGGHKTPLKLPMRSPTSSVIPASW